MSLLVNYRRTLSKRLSTSTTFEFHTGHMVNALTPACCFPFQGRSEERSRIDIDATGDNLKHAHQFYFNLKGRINLIKTLMTKNVGEQQLN